MRNLYPSDLLALWERGHTLHPLDRALLVLGAALPGTGYDALADWPLGRRNAMLAAVRCACFGRRLEGWSSCVQCGEKLELDVDGNMLARDAETEPHQANESITVGGHTFRLPTTRDLAGIIHEQDSATAAQRLMNICRRDAGDSLTPSDLTPHDLEVIGESLSKADPMAEILLSMPCPVCGHEGSATLDLIAFFWTELEVRAKRLLLDVHHLASAYGWSESHILALSDHRRAFYLGMVQA